MADAQERADQEVRLWKMKRVRRWNDAVCFENVLQAALTPRPALLSPYVADQNVE